MLLRLHLENLALIERADLEPAPGLNVLTGETGAGKTMLAEAIGLLAGGQAAAGLIGPHADEVINLFGLAIRHNLTADDLKTTMFAYPTGASDIGDML